jgi:hypothetical protein
MSNALVKRRQHVVRRRTPLKPKPKAQNIALKVTKAGTPIPDEDDGNITLIELDSGKEGCFIVNGL